MLPVPLTKYPGVACLQVNLPYDPDEQSAATVGLLSSLSSLDGKPSPSPSDPTLTSKMFRFPLLFQSLSDEPM